MAAHPVMAAQKLKKKSSEICFCIFECLLPQNPFNESFQLSWFFKTKWKTITKSKKGGFQELSLIMPKNDFNLTGTSSTYHKFRGQNIKRNQSKRLQKLNFTIFWVLHF